MLEKNRAKGKAKREVILAQLSVAKQQRLKARKREGLSHEIKYYLQIGA